MGKNFLCTISLLLLMLPLSVSATWKIANPSRGAPTPPHTTVTGYPDRYQAKVAIFVDRGYLYDSIKRIAQKHGWGLVWYPRKNYPVFTPAVFTGDTFVNAMSRLMSHYPLVVTYHVDYARHAKLMIVKPINRPKPYKHK